MYVMVTKCESVYGHGCEYWLKSYFAYCVLQSYRPITVLALRFSYALHGRETFWYHVTNTVLHAAVSVTLYYTCLVVFKGNRMISFVCALFFAVHPIHTDAVDSIVGRAEVMYALFFLLSFLAYVKAAQPKHTHWPMFALSTGLCVLSTLSKEIGIMALGKLPETLSKANLHTIYRFKCGLRIVVYIQRLV